MNKEIKIITIGDIFENLETEEKALKFIDYINNLQKKCENAVADYELEKYKNIKALSWTNRIIEIIKQQPTEDDIWILENLHSIKYLLQGSDKKMEYFKLNKDKREIIIDKYKKYNVNIDILDLIIDLKCENDRLNNIINELEKYINKLNGQTKTAIAFNKGINDIYETKKYERDNYLFEIILDKLKELKENK